MQLFFKGFIGKCCCKLRTALNRCLIYPYTQIPKVLQILRANKNDKKHLDNKMILECSKVWRGFHNVEYFFFCRWWWKPNNMLYCENTNQTLLIMPNIKKYLEHQMVRKNVNLKAEMPSLYAAFCFRELIVCFGEHVPQI